jgi:hypothetical protein
MKRFYLLRDVDESGISGTGRVAEGVVFRDGRAVLTWLTATESLAIYSSMDAVERVHGHGGKTQIIWIDK